MTTPSREEAPELKACPFCGVNGTAYIAFPRFETPWHIAFDHAEDCPLQGWEGFTYTTKAEATEAWNTRADLANREPSEGDVERIGRAVWAALSDAPLPDRDCQRAMEKAGLAAINAWRNP